MSDKTAEYKLGYEHGFREGMCRALHIVQCKAAGIDINSIYDGGSPQPAPLTAQVEGSDSESGRGQPSPLALTGG